MNEHYDNDLAYQQAAEERRRRRQARRRRERNLRLASMVVFLLVAAGLTVFLATRFDLFGSSRGAGSGSPNNNPDGTIIMEKETEPVSEVPVTPVTETPVTEAMTEAEPAVTASANQDILTEAKNMAMGYDYDGAIALLQTIPGYESISEVTAAIDEYTATKASCVPVDVNTVPHIFYHSLINDTSSAFNTSVLGQFAVDGMNAWMTTISEFDSITQQLYDNGYVYVRLRDLVVETVDANGNVTFEPNNNLLLPEGKKAIVLSIDDLSYYHSYEPASYPDKLVLDDNGVVKCHYVKPDGTEEVGDFDVVPRLNTFLTEHPDGAYKGARGLIALTGYNGVFGYRTDVDYRDKLNLMADQAKWLEEHPDFDFEGEIEQAKVIAEAIKESGWEFASHTWGHLSVTNKTADELRIDNEKWINTVQNIVGPVDTIIFAHGNDIGDWQDYSADNEKFQYFKNAGYNYFCNVDGSVPYWVQIRSNYVRQGRINLDGYMLYQSSQGATTVLDHMFKASQAFDHSRPTPVVANGEG